MEVVKLFFFSFSSYILPSAGKTRSQLQVQLEPKTDCNRHARSKYYGKHLTFLRATGKIEKKVSRGPSPYPKLNFIAQDPDRGQTKSC